MATAIASGRVDAATKARADRYIKAAGLTANDLIRSLWESIAQTKKVPTFGKQEIAVSHTFEDFVAYADSMVPCDPDASDAWFIHMTDKEMHSVLGERNA